MQLTIKEATPSQIAKSLSIQQIEQLLQKACESATFCTKQQRATREKTAQKIKEALQIAISIKG